MIETTPDVWHHFYGEVDFTRAPTYLRVLVDGVRLPVTPSVSKESL